MNGDFTERGLLLNFEFQANYNSWNLDSLFIMSKRAVDESESGAKAEKKPRQKKVKGIEGVSDEDFKSTDAANVKALLINGHVKTFAKMCDDDWHDGYEEQGQEIRDYKVTLQPIMQAVYNISVIQQKEFVRCHEVLKLFGDSWQNLNNINTRCDVRFDFACEGDLSVRIANEGAGLEICNIVNGDDILAELWPRLILAAATCTTDYKVSDEVLAVMIKDATDFEVNCLKIPEDEEKIEDNMKMESVLASEAAGLARLTALVNNKEAWENLPTTRKKPKKFKVIDRRFSGEKHRRTRDYDSDDNYNGW